MIQSNQIIDAYILCAEKTHPQKFILEMKAKEYAESFLLHLSKRYNLNQIGDSWLKLYLAFQFNYWKQLTITIHGGVMKFAYIFGNKALKRFLDRKEEYDWQLLTNSLQLPLSMVSFLFSEKKNSHYNGEDIYRARFHNQPEQTGIAYCNLYTSLYDNKSNYCLTCNDKATCIEMLRMNYPQQYKQRVIHG